MFRAVDSPRILDWNPLELPAAPRVLRLVPALHVSPQVGGPHVLAAVLALKHALELVRLLGRLLRLLLLLLLVAVLFGAAVVAVGGSWGRWGGGGVLRGGGPPCLCSSLLGRLLAGGSF